MFELMEFELTVVWTSRPLPRFFPLSRRVLLARPIQTSLGRLWRCVVLAFLFLGCVFSEEFLGGFGDAGDAATVISVLRVLAMELLLELFDC